MDSELSNQPSSVNQAGSFGKVLVERAEYDRYIGDLGRHGPPFIKSLTFDDWKKMMKTAEASQPITKPFSPS